MTKRKPKSEHKKDGRHTVFTPDVLQKLEDAFMFCYTDEEACLYADISPRSLYNYQDENPEFVQRKELLRKAPNLKAKKVLVENVGSLEQARWWADRKMNDEFSTKTKVEMTDSLDDVDVDPEDMAASKIFQDTLRQNVINRRLAKKGK